ncbi:MAG: hypothetical protein GF335_00980 [Candidatus Moranbacteria bacterium]|nr:hypothetical protein [Candidatus Moranbacteria bacterium]
MKKQIIGLFFLIALFFGCSDQKLQKNLVADIDFPVATETSPAKNPKTNQEFYPVLKVVDGDTITVNIKGRQEKIRMIGLDTPETVDPRKPVQCFGKEASNKAKELLANKKVRLEKDPSQGDRDKYNRLLRYVYLEDGTLYNKLMIEQGFAHEYTYNIPYKYQNQFKTAQKQARKNKRGLWGDKCKGNTTQAAKQNSDQSKQDSATSSSQTSNQIKNNSNFICDCSKLCSQMQNCDEAQFQLEKCGCKQRDGDNDGIACNSLCK